jgi:cytochrome b561
MPAQSHGRYSAAQITLHWLIAALVLFQLVFGESMEEFIEAREEGEALSSTDALLGTLHYWIGLAILALVAVRLVLRLRSGAAPVVAETNPWLEIAAKAVHWAFYVLLLGVPVIGLLAYYYDEPFAEIHALAKPAFISLIVIHAGAALLHQFWLRDGLLTSMLRPGNHT